MVEHRTDERVAVAAPPTWPATATLRLPGRAAAARGARGARGAAQAARRGPPGHRDRAHRRGERAPTRSCATTSVVATGYGPHGGLRRHGRRRADPDGLPRTPGAVRAVARYVSRILDDRGTEDTQRRTGVSQDLYGILGVPGRGRRRHQEGLPQARPPAAPRRQPRPGDAGAVQGGHARLRGAVRPAEARGVRPRRRPVRPAGFGVGQGAGFSFTDIMDAFFGGQGRRRQPPRPALARSRRGQDALIRLDIDLAGGGVRGHPRDQGRHGGRLRDLRRRGRRARQPRRSPARPAAAGRGRRTCSARSSARSAPCGRARPAAASARSSPTRAASAPATAGSAPAAP